MKLQDIIFYSSLSEDGKNLIQECKQKSIGVSSGFNEITKRLSKGNKSVKKEVRRCFLSADRGFEKFVPKTYLLNAGIPRQQNYLRLVKIASMLLLEHKTFFSAYNISIDRKAEERSVLFSFLKRVYDDLKDEMNESPESLKVFTGSLKNDSEEHNLLLHFKRKIGEIAPKDFFPNFYQLVPETHKYQMMLAEKQNAEEITNKKARLSFLIDSYVMQNELSAEFIEGRGFSAELFQCLDDLYDLEEDLGAGKLTLVNQIKNPEYYVRQKFEDVAGYIRNSAPNPKEYLFLMKELTEGVIGARKTKSEKIRNLI